MGIDPFRDEGAIRAENQVLKNEKARDQETIDRLKTELKAKNKKTKKEKKKREPWLRPLLNRINKKRQQSRFIPFLSKHKKKAGWLIVIALGLYLFEPNVAYEFDGKIIHIVKHESVKKCKAFKKKSGRLEKTCSEEAVPYKYLDYFLYSFDYKDKKGTLNTIELRANKRAHGWIDYFWAHKDIGLMIFKQNGARPVTNIIYNKKKLPHIGQKVKIYELRGLFTDIKSIKYPIINAWK